MKEIRLILNKKEAENFEIVKGWYNEKTDTGVVRNLIKDKYQEIKKIQLLGKTPYAFPSDIHEKTIKEEN